MEGKAKVLVKKVEFSEKKAQVLPVIQEETEDMEEDFQKVSLKEGQFPKGPRPFTITEATDYPQGGITNRLRCDLRPVCLAGWSHGDHGVRPIWNVGHRFPVQFHFKPTRPVPSNVEHL